MKNEASVNGNWLTCEGLSDRLADGWYGCSICVFWDWQSALLRNIFGVFWSEMNGFNYESLHEFDGTFVDMITFELWNFALHICIM